MKKILVVLTILVLVAGFAFAAVSGSVEAKYDFDFSDETVSYGVSETNAKLGFTLITENAEVAGEAKPYASVKVGLVYSGEVKKASGKAMTWDSTKGVYYVAISASPSWKLTLSEFKLVGEKWELNFLKAIGVGDYAKSAWEIDNDATNSGKALDAKWFFNDKQGVTFTYDGFKVGIAATKTAGLDVDEAYEIVYLTAYEVSKMTTLPAGVTYSVALDPAVAAENVDLAKEWNAVGNMAGLIDGGRPKTEGYYVKHTNAIPGEPKSSFDLRAESKEIALGDYVTAQAAVALGFSKVSDNDIVFDFGLSAKAAYKSEDVSATIAADLERYAGNFNYDVSLNVAVAPVTFDAYYAKEIQIASENSIIGEKKNFLSARVIVDVAPVKITAVAENVLNEGDRLFGIKEEGTFGALTEEAQFGIYPFDESLAIWFANGEVGYTVSEGLKVVAGFGLYDIVFASNDYDLFYAMKAGATYETDMFKIDGAAYLRKFADEDAKASFKLAVSSEKLVEKAVLSATLLFNENYAIELYDATRAIDSFNNGGMGFDREDFEIRNALVLACKVAF